MGNLTAKTSGEIASFMTPAKTNIKSLKVHFSPKQLGTGDPSPENVREIEGWDGVEVNGSGKNLLNISNLEALIYKDYNNFIINKDKSITITGRSFVLFLVPVKSNTTYLYSLIASSNTNHFMMRVLEYSEKPTEIVTTNWLVNSGIANKSSFSFTTSANTTWLLVGFYNNDTYTSDGNQIISNLQLELGSSTTSYEPYQGNTISYQWKLPDEYQEVEYIESTGEQYIDTSINLSNSNFEIKTEFELTEYTSQEQSIFSIWTSGYGYWNLFIRPNYNSVDVYTNAHHDIDSNRPIVELNTKNTISLKRKSSQWTASFNEYTREWTYTPTSINETSLKLFRRGDIPVIGSSNTHIKMYSCKVYILDNIIADFIPCYRKSDGEIGMYDMVSKTFFTNQGNDTFLKGNDVDKTFYGGYVDLISGELVEEWVGAKKKLSEANNKTLNSNGVIAYTFNFAIPYGQIINKNSQKCNICMYNWNMADVKRNHFFGYYNASTGNRFLLFLLENNGLSDDTEVDFVAPLTTPITHQLTPTQLKSFVGQNNFWSNADYVEIEYDLIETIDIQKAKQKIILSQPQLKTVSDKAISFNTDMVAPLKNCKIYFKPIQLGSGDPSPTNVRDINGWTGIDSYVNGDKISIDWTSEAGTVYGGYLDLTKGEVVANMTVVEFDGSSDENWQVETLSSGLTNYYMYATSLIPKARGNQRTDGYICSNMCIPRGVDETYTSGMFYFSNSGALNVYLGGKSNTTTVAEFKSWLTEHKLQIAYWLKTPIHYPLSSLTSQQLLTIKSTNYIWSETNGQQIDVKYWSHKNLTPTPLTDYLENQTWTDSAYISSSGKKTTGGTSASHFLTNQILLEAGTYVLSGFSYYVGTDNTNFRIHAYDSTGKWLRQIAYKQIGNLSPVDISFTLDTDTYVNVSIAMDFDGVLTKIN